MNWLEQRIDFLTLPTSSRRPLSQPLDWHTIFRQSKDDGNCAGIILIAGDETCRALFNTAPVTPPDNFRGDGRVYRLWELDTTTRGSGYIWKAEHYCKIAADKDFPKIMEAPTHNQDSVLSGVEQCMDPRRSSNFPPKNGLSRSGLRP